MVNIYTVTGGDFGVFQGASEAALSASDTVRASNAETSLWEGRAEKLSEGRIPNGRHRFAGAKCRSKTPKVTRPEGLRGK